ncbi:MAG: APC family permease [Pirellulales bacterium]|nr:APC family permease [Pirellulales bacterium]
MQFQRSIGLVGLTFVAISGIIGSGWLFAPLLTSQLAGPAAILSWLIGGFAMLTLALCFAEVMSVLPVAGGIARIPHLTHGDVTSSILGWSAWVGYNTAAPIETIALLEYLGAQFPSLFDGGASRGDLSATGCVAATIILAIFVGINSIGAAALARANSFITWIKLAVPIAIGIALVSTRFNLDNFSSHGFAPSGIEGVLAAVSSGGVIFALIGFRHAIDLAGEVKRPHVTIPLSLTLALIICVGIYLLLQVAFVGGLTTQQLAGGWANLAFEGNLGPIAVIAAGLGLVWVKVALHTGALLGPFGGGLVAMGSMARLGYALSQNGFFPRALERLSQRGVPMRALMMNFVFGALVIILLPFSEAVAINAAAITISFTGGPLAVYALRQQMPDAPRPFRMPLGTPVSALAFIVATFIVYWSGWETTWRLGLVVAVGLALFAAKKAFERVSVAQLDLISASWLVPYGIGIGVVSYFGNYGGGQGIVATPWDSVALAFWSLGVFAMANRCRLSNETAAKYRERYATPPNPDITPV